VKGSKACSFLIGTPTVALTASAKYIVSYSRGTMSYLSVVWYRRPPHAREVATHYEFRRHILHRSEFADPDSELRQRRT
jgi:hypothetical protein